MDSNQMNLPVDIGDQSVLSVDRESLKRLLPRDNTAENPLDQFLAIRKERQRLIQKNKDKKLLLHDIIRLSSLNFN